MEECNNAYANESSLSTHRVCYQASVGKMQVSSLMQHFFYAIFSNMGFDENKADVETVLVAMSGENESHHTW